MVSPVKWRDCFPLGTGRWVRTALRGSGGTSRLLTDRGRRSQRLAAGISQAASPPPPDPFSCPDLILDLNPAWKSLSFSGCLPPRLSLDGELMGDQNPSRKTGRGPPGAQSEPRAGPNPKNAHSQEGRELKCLQRPLGTFLPSPLPCPAASIKGIELFCPASPSETLPTPPLSLRLGMEGEGWVCQPG